MAMRRNERPLRILYNHRTQSRDGQFVHIEELITALRALGHEVVLIEPRHVRDTRLGDESRAGANAKRYIPAPLYEMLELFYSVPEFARLLLACMKARPDLLYQRANLYMVSGMLCARVLGSRILSR